MRRTISLIVALALTAAGGLVLASQLFGSRWYGVMVLAGCTMLGLGVYWLWADFINATPKEEG